ncbi:MAG: lytic transglycosylase domain-containing protein [Alphaproteobacteria bacterium]|nr:lytic transglycosylase domain-containing protein [Alphaproteobacteria bacterium]
MKSFYHILPVLLITATLALPPVEASAASPDAQNYRRALSAIEAGRVEQALDIAAHGRDPVLNKVIKSYAMAQPGNNFSFHEMAEFITTHPDWPCIKGILMIAEQKIPQSYTNEQVINWFNAYAPVTLIGFYRYTDALEAAGNAQKAYSLVRARWIERDFSNDELTVFHGRFSHILSLKDHHARLDRLLWENEITDARQMYKFVDSGVKALAEARLGLSNQLSNAESLVSKVPDHWQNDPGLLFERLKWRRKNNLDESAIEILSNAPAQLIRPDKWWDERNIMIRRAMERKDFKLSYRLAADNGLIAGSDFVDAEFIAGWLALKFLNRPDLARTHFDNILQSATSPISRARGSYWLGRTMEVLGDKREAEQSYENAAALNTTFYGQLAATRLYAKPTIVASPEPAIPRKVLNEFMRRDLTQAIERLYRIGATDRARIFFKAATESADQRVEFVLLTELAYRLKRPDWAITAAKAANQKNMIMASNAYPILSMHIPSPPDPAFTHSLIRQESLFNADALSPAGARGLMQMLPRTAKDVARKVGVPFKAQRLNDPDYNVLLGTYFIQEQINRFDGSYILALAAYNAGPGRVREWINLFGDPRDTKTDPIDWLEIIPIYETRNYVQRIMENFQIYRARLNGGKANLTILQDLRR